MQRQVNENGETGIIISCDFCGTDWDQQTAMVEGHHGSVLCLECFKQARKQMTPAARAFDCTLCLQTRPTDTPHWRHAPFASPPPGFNPEAVVCEPCLKQAAAAFHKDPDVPWSKREQ